MLHNASLFYVPIFLRFLDLGLVLRGFHCGFVPAYTVLDFVLFRDSAD